MEKPKNPGRPTDSAGREDYALHVRLITRWSDYDMLGHVNNVEYYRYFETGILTLLRETGWCNGPGPREKAFWSAVMLVMTLIWYATPATFIYFQF